MLSSHHISSLAPAALYRPDPLGVATQQDVYTSCSNLLFEHGFINDVGKFSRSLMERDLMGPTIVPDLKFAIPHGQDESVLQPCVSVCMFSDPIEFKTPFVTAMVQKVFLFCLPLGFEGHPAYPTLQAFSALLANPAFIGEISASTPYEDFCHQAGAAMLAGTHH